MLLAEGIPGRLHPEDGRRTNVIGALGLSQQSLAIYADGERLVDVTWDDGAARELDLSTEERGLRVGFDAAQFTEARTGRYDLQLSLADAQAVLTAIEQRRRELPRRRRLADRDQ